jgi:hypothetical protein
MFFKKKDGHAERWKLIDFDSACIVDKDIVKIVTNYSAPEIIRAHENKTEIKANFAMDMFSFGLVLYFLETGTLFNGAVNSKQRYIIYELPNNYN